MRKSKYGHLLNFSLYPRRKIEAEDSMGIACNFAGDLVLEIDEIVASGKTSYRNLYYFLGAVMKHCQHMQNLVSPPIKYSINYNKWQKGLVALDCNGLIDHEHRRKLCGKIILTSHPYRGTMENMREVIDVCTCNNLNFILRGEDFYFPGHTFCINFWKRSKK